MAFRYPACVAVISLLLAWCIFGKSIPVICADSSRLATIESLVHRRTFDISDSMFIVTCDKIRVPVTGEPASYYSDKTPFFSVLGAGVYQSLVWLGADMRRDIALPYRLLVLFLVVFPAFGIIGLSHLYLCAKGVPSRVRFFVYLVSVFGSLVLPYSMVLNSHVFAAALVLASYVFLENPMGYAKIGSAWISGVAAGLAMSMDLSSVFFVFSFFLLCAHAFWPHTKRALVGFSLGCAVSLGVSFLLFKLTSGSWFPYVIQAENYLYDGSPVPSQVVFGGGGGWLPVSSYCRFVWHALVGYRGVFSHSLALVLGFAVLFRMSQAKTDRASAMAVLLPILVLLFFLTVFMPTSYGGSSFGFRYMILWMPLVALFSYPFFGQVTSRRWVVAVLGFSLVTSGSGMISPWLIHSWDPLDLHSFDFLAVHDPSLNPYRVLASQLAPYQKEISALKQNESQESLVRMALLYFKAQRPDLALGSLQRVPLYAGSENWHCYAQTVFSDKGIGLLDLMHRHAKKCSN